MKPFTVVKLGGSLLEEAALRATEAGVAVHWGRCSELDGAPAFWPWVQVLRSVWANGESPTPDDVLAALKLVPRDWYEVASAFFSSWRARPLSPFW